jgi:hypothetical protein
MTIELIRADELRLVASGPGKQGRIGVVYQVVPTGEMYRWDGSKHSRVSGDGPSRLPTFLPFGCSISEQCNAYLHSEAANVTAVSRAGANTIQVNSGAAFANGTRIVYNLYNARLQPAVVQSVAGNVLTLTTPLPGMVRIGTSVGTIPGTQEWPQLNQGYGIINSAICMLGMPVEVLPAYGYGGARCWQMIQDLRRDLRYYRPDYVGLHMFDNDLTGLVSGGAATVDQLKAFARYMARMCLDHGATPIVYAQLPYFNAGTGIGVSAARAADYDELARYIGSAQSGDLARDVPGAWGDNSVATAWLDTSNATWPRAPQAGFTDGVHPLVSKRFAAGAVGLPVMRQLLGRRESHSELFLTPAEISTAAGSTGTVASMQAGSVAPTGWTISAFGTVVATSSKRPDGSVRIVADWPGAASLSNDYVWARYTYTPQVVWAASTSRFKVIMRFRLARNVGLSRVYCEVHNGIAERWTSLTGTGYMESMPTSDDAYVMETPVFSVPQPATSLTIGMQIRVVDAASPANAACTIDILELGIIEAHPEVPVGFI